MKRAPVKCDKAKETIEIHNTWDQWLWIGTDPDKSLACYGTITNLRDIRRIKRFCEQIIRKRTKK